MRSYCRRLFYSDAVVSVRDSCFLRAVCLRKAKHSPDRQTTACVCMLRWVCPPHGLPSLVCINMEHIHTGEGCKVVATGRGGNTETEWFLLLTLSFLMSLYHHRVTFTPRERLLCTTCACSFNPATGFDPYVTHKDQQITPTGASEASQHIFITVKSSRITWLLHNAMPAPLEMLS